jgi:protein phosphatase
MGTVHEKPIPVFAGLGDTLPILVPGSGSRLQREAPAWDAAGMTRKGATHAANEDQFLIAELGRSVEVLSSSAPDGRRRVVPGAQARLLAVADGLGGRPGGELASAVAIDALAEHLAFHTAWLSVDGPDREGILAAIGAAMIAAEHRVHVVSPRKGLSPDSPATTLTAAMIVWPLAFVTHVGDSRLYHLSGEKLVRVTHDHTLIERFRQLGLLREGDEQRMAHVLYNVIGGAEDVHPELHTLELAHGDVLLLCTDGVSRWIDDADLGDQLGDERATAKRLVHELVDTALARGSADDTTAVVARF